MAAARSRRDSGSMRRSERKALAVIRARMAAVGEAPDEMTDRELRAAIRGWLRRPDAVVAFGDALTPPTPEQSSSEGLPEPV
jgi:hypothetical protein